MGMTCSICRDPRRKEIDLEIMRGAGRRAIAGRFPPLSATAIERHKIKCTSTALETAAEKQSWTITGQMRTLCNKAAATLERAEKSGKIHDTAIASREARETLMALAKLTGELDESTRVNVMIAQREAQAGEQTSMLERLTIGERAQLAALIAKAEGATEAIEAPIVPADSGPT